MLIERYREHMTKAREILAALNTISRLTGEEIKILEVGDDGK